jgi:heat shock protein HslJ
MRPSLMNLSRAVPAAAVAAVILSLTGCGSSASNSTGAGATGAGGDHAQPSNLDVAYVVTAATEAGKPHNFVPGSQVRLAFSGGRLLITAGCNSMSATYTLVGSHLKVGGLATTEMGCPARLMSQDAWVAKLFDGPEEFTGGRHPSLTSGAVVLTLVDRKVASPDVSLSGTHWVLDTIIESSTASSVPAGVAASIVITGRAVVVNDGCDYGDGPVVVHGAELRFGKITMSVRPCPSTHDQLASAFAAVLTGTASYSITESSLQISRGGHGLGFRAADR